MARRPTDAEWASLVHAFPNLVRNDVWITAEPTATYNCIAYSLLIYDQWINPLSPQTLFENQYAGYGYQVTGADAATIDGWGKNGGADMTHGSRVSTTMPASGLWESKLGASFRITHGREQLDSAVYGSILTHFDRQRPVSIPTVKITVREEQELAERARAVDPELFREFTDLLRAWKDTWSKLEIQLSSASATRATGPAFDALVELGEPSVPLVMRELPTKDGFFLLPLLDRIMHDAVLDREHPLESEQSRAARTVRRWLATQP